MSVFRKNKRFYRYACTWGQREHDVDISDGIVEKCGITSYICGQSGQRISESYYMLKHALDYQSPQVVLLETNMLFRYTNTPDSLCSSISDTVMYYFPGVTIS